MRLPKTTRLSSVFYCNIPYPVFVIVSSQMYSWLVLAPANMLNLVINALLGVTFWGCSGIIHRGIKAWGSRKRPV